MCRILALETTEKNATVAVWEKNRILCEIRPEGRSAQTFAPAMQILLDQIGWKANDIQCIAVGVGPGSFTGLRVGITAAKMFAYATGAKIIGVDTLLALAVAIKEGTKRVSVAVDAQRSEIVAQNFEIRSDGPVPFGPQRIIPIAKWWEFGKDGVEDAEAEKIIFSGPILRRIEKNVPVEITLADRSFWEPQAISIAQIAAARFHRNEFDDLWSLVPHYSRPSAAEERKELGIAGDSDSLKAGCS